MRRAALGLLLLALGGGPAAAQEAPGRLAEARLEAILGPGGDAEATVTLLLAGVSGWEALPLRTLEFGGVPSEVSASVGGGLPVPLALFGTRPGAWEGRLPLAPGGGDTTLVVLTYRVPGALRGTDAAGPRATLALPWLVVPWPPEDGAPGRVEVALTFSGPVRLDAAFPARFAPGGEGADVGVDAPGKLRVSSRWRASLPVLPSLTRAEATGPGARVAAAPSVGSEAPTGPGNPPTAPPPGFVFTGLFGAFLLVTVGYAAWMVRSEGRASAGTDPGREG